MFITNYVHLHIEVKNGAYAAPIVDFTALRGSK